MDPHEMTPEQLMAAAEISHACLTAGVAITKAMEMGALPANTWAMVRCLPIEGDPDSVGIWTFITSPN